MLLQEECLKTWGGHDLDVDNMDTKSRKHDITDIHGEIVEDEPILWVVSGFLFLQ